jgi:hypothetical protein
VDGARPSCRAIARKDRLMLSPLDTSKNLLKSAAI